MPPDNDTDLESKPQRVRVKKYKKSDKRKRRGVGKAQNIYEKTIFSITDAVLSLDYLIQVLLIAIIALAPLPLGSVAPWAQSTLFLCSCLLLILWTIKQSLQGKIEIIKSPVWYFIFAYVLLIGLQLVPMPQKVLSGLSPSTAKIYTLLIPGYPTQADAMPLSLSPYGTMSGMFKFVSIAIVFFIVLNQFRKKWQVTSILWTFAGIGLFQCLYGLFERFSGNPHIFWMPITRDAACLHGTYVGRNHFAGLMEMITPAVCGLLLALLSRRRKTFTSQLSLKNRIIENLYKGKNYNFIILGILTSGMFVCGMLSISRAGILGLLISFGILFVFSLKERKRQNNLKLVLILILFVGVGAVFLKGLEPILARFEQEIAVTSWEGRKDLRQGGIQLIKDFPALGTGAGTFKNVFLPYQPAIFGDKVANYLHCDWLQVFCETGVLGSMILYIGFCLFFFIMFKKIQKRSDSFSFYLAVGAFSGITAMLVHSLFDYNLYKITANALIFTILLGICYTALHMKGRANGSKESFPLWTILLSTKSRRVLFSLLIFLVCIAASIIPIKSLLADVAFNRYLAWPQGVTNKYFFWKCPSLDKDEAKQYLDKATNLAPLSPEYHLHQGLFQVKLIEESVQALARDMAIKVFLKKHSFASASGDPVQDLAKDIRLKSTPQDEAINEESEEFKALLATFVPPAKIKLQEKILSVLREAEPHFRRAIELAPTVPWHYTYLALAYLKYLVPGYGLEQEMPKIEKLIQHATRLAPNRPATQFYAGWYFIMKSRMNTAGGLDGTDEQQKALALFKKALGGEPVKYARDTYTILLGEAGASPGALVGITPSPQLSQKILFKFLAQRRLWAEALPVVEKHLVSLAMDPQNSQIPDVHPESDEFKYCIQASYWHMQVLQRLNMPDAFNRELNRYFTLKKQQSPDMMNKASWFISKNRLTEARKTLTDCLALDWNNLDAFLGLTEILLRPGVNRGKDITETTLQEIIRLFHTNPKVSPANCERINEILSGLKPSLATDHIKFQLAKALTRFNCNQKEEALKILKALLLVDVPSFRYWHQRHLIHYHLGRILEMDGEQKEAAREYVKAITLAPAHKASLARLAALGWKDKVIGLNTVERTDEQTSSEEQEEQEGSETSEVAELPSIGERLAAITPEAPWGIDFAGKFTFLGLTVDGVNVRYFWKVTDDLKVDDYKVWYEYFNIDGDLILRDRRVLLADEGIMQETLAGGIGTVLVHDKYLPFPLEIVQEVRIRLRPIPKRKVAFPFLKMVTGETGIWIGMGRDG